VCGTWGDGGGKRMSQQPARLLSAVNPFHYYISA
jgi:hypothetical protein